MITLRVTFKSDGISASPAGGSLWNSYRGKIRNNKSGKRVAVVNAVALRLFSCQYGYYIVDREQADVPGSGRSKTAGMRCNDGPRMMYDRMMRSRWLLR